MASLYHVFSFGVYVLNYYLYVSVFLPVHYHVHVNYNLPFFLSHTGSHLEIDGVTFSVSELDVNRKYRILGAKRLTTRFGATVIHTVKCEDAASAQIFLPTRYGDVFTDTDLEQFNSNALFLHLIYTHVPLKSLPVGNNGVLRIFHYRLTCKHETPRHGV